MESPIKKKKEDKKVRSVPEMNNLEHINAQLKGKLKIITIEMKDAVERMNSMAEEMNSIKSENFSCKDRLSNLEREKALLVSQIEEMVNERAERDAIIEEFSTAVEARIVEWKEILDEKDSTIAKLKENLIYAATDKVADGLNPDKKITNINNNNNVGIEIERLIRDIDRRDEIIAELQTKLSQAVVEINESSLLIEKFRSDRSSGRQDTLKRNNKEQRNALKKAEDTSKRISTLEIQLERAEKDAKVKSEQLCEALAILNKYEDEDSSLADALEEIKDLKNQLNKKNKYIEDLVDVVNRLEIENSRYEEAIIILRDRIELGEGEEFSLENLILQRQQDQDDKDEETKRNYNQLSSENVDLKFQIRKLKTALKESLKNKLNKTSGVVSDGEQHFDDSSSHRSESQKDQVELHRIKENVKWIIEENEALRQGMHEILDSIHNQDGKGIITIQSQTLENLLQALDARHLAGWYHPAMRLQGRVNYLQGSNAELRAQLQQLRQNQLLHEADGLQHSSSIEEGECRRPAMMITSDIAKINELPLTPKSSRSVHSLNADSGRASGKAVESDDLLQSDTPEDGIISESTGDTPLNEDEGFGKKSEEIYAMAKEIIAQESDHKDALNNAEKRQKELELRVITLRKNLANFVAPEVYSELRQRCLDMSMRCRASLEDKLANEDGEHESTKDQTISDLRDELSVLHKRLAEWSIPRNINDSTIDPETLKELENRVNEFELENKKLQRSVEIAREEAQKHRAIDSTVLAEFNELRRRVARIEEDGESQDIKEQARLALEVANCKVVETKLREDKKSLERDLTLAKEELDSLRRVRQESDGDIEKQADNREYREIIDFLQQQYAGSTSLSAYERYEDKMNKLNENRNEVKELIAQINDRNENLKIQHETLTSRLQIVEQLKDMLEQQIGSNEVQDIMKRFTEESKKMMSESKYKARIDQLEEETQSAKKNLADYENKVKILEEESIKAQKAWQIQRKSSSEYYSKRIVTLDKVTETKFEDNLPVVETVDKSVQIELRKLQSVESQCALCSCKLGFNSNEVKNDMMKVKQIKSNEFETSSEDETVDKDINVSLLQEKLSQALKLASERSISLSKSESQVVELKSKINSLKKLLDEREFESMTINATVPTKDNDTVDKNFHQQLTSHFTTSQEALHSTINTLEKIIAQKEETIARYQSLLKEDRDKHSEAAARLHDEIKSLKKCMEIEGRRKLGDNNMVGKSECPERDLSSGLEIEETSLQKEKISRLETELSISTELAERWHRLAEDRLRHMDSMRERLEEQHKEEIDSYRKELNKSEQEINELRRLVSESRRAPSTKTEVLSFIKALQIKDNRLADKIENELEHHASVITKQQQQQLSTTYTVEDSRIFETEQSQSQLDNLQKQLQASREREKSRRNEIAELQQQLNRRHLAVKAQEKKASRREIQLERKVKELEEELHEAKEILDRHFMVQQAKRAKTAEDLGLWEKLKKWQQTAEKLKEKLKDKSDECQRLQVNYEKLRNLISCMERERLFLRERKFRSESSSTRSTTTTPPTLDVVINDNNEALVEELRAECHELRCRIKELLDRLSQRESNILDERKKSVNFAAFEDDDYANGELQKMKEIQELLEKENLRLEAENFELRLEIERANVNLPRCEEKIQHLEKYIELLKTEKSSEVVVPRRNEGVAQRTKSELERTVVTLKNLVEKLQQENKRLRNTVIQTDLDTQCNCPYLRDEYEQAKHRIAFLETELELAQRKIALMAETNAITTADKSMSENVAEIALLREQLSRKSEVLFKVKDLLAKATANEKALRQRIQQLEYNQTLSAIPECGSSLTIT